MQNVVYHKETPTNTTMPHLASVGFHTLESRTYDELTQRRIDNALATAHYAIQSIIAQATESFVPVVEESQ
jgi:hypothetical protein